MKYLILSILFLFPIFAMAENAENVPEQTLEQTVVDLLNKSASVLSDASQTMFDVSKEQLPDIVDQYLRWQFVSNLSVSVILLIIPVGLFFLTRKYWKSDEPWEVHDHQAYSRSATTTDHGVIGAIVTVLFVASVIVSPFVICYHMDWLQILIAPKVYLLETFKNLIH